MKLSCVMIVKNEEEMLARCLDSIKGADELIICDTGSVDKTIEIAQKYTDKIYTDFKWCDDFSKARNHSISKATGDWCLTIDADEYLLPGGMELIRQEIDKAEKNGFKTVDVMMDSGYSTFYFPRLFKKHKDVYYKGAIHNYLSMEENNYSEIKIHYDYSPAHKKDPDRALRILKKEVDKDPEKPRETFYLAREYWYYQKYYEAIFYFEKYVTKLATWGPEWAEAYWYLAKCYNMIGENDKAKMACMGALKINADYKDAMLLMADLCGPNNRKSWLTYAQFAENKNALTNGMPPERDEIYYNNLFSDSSDMSRYEELNKLAGKWCKGKVLDIGCGVGQMQNYVKDWHGFDFSETAIKIANNPNAWVGSAYDKNNYGDYDTYLASEVFEHLDDYKVLHNIPTGKLIVFSVPSFTDPSHLRVYTEETVRIRYQHFIDIEEIVRFNWKSKWVKGGKETNEYILLVRGVRY